LILDAKLIMKNIFYLFLLVSSIATAQYDFDTRYFKIDAASLPEVQVSDEFDFSLKKGPVLFSDLPLPTSKITSDNYWQAVNMMEVIEIEKTYVDTEAQALSLNGFRVGIGQPLSNSDKKLTNFVYKEANGLDFIDPCPPFGICHRCAPYRMSRGY
jgi:hypothetical protein